MADVATTIFSGGIFTETNTFSPIPTGYESFSVIESSALNSDDVRDGSYPPFDVWKSKAEADGYQFKFGFFASANPAGPTTSEAFERLATDFINSIKDAGEIDIVILLLHGAMVSDAVDDCEGELLRRSRGVIGSKAVLAVELDLHCHLTQKMMRYADIIISFKEYPHVDITDRARELYQLALKTKNKQCSPVMVAIDCHMIGLYPTSTLVMRRFLNSMYKAEKLPDILSVSFIHGFPYGDVEEGGSKLLVISDADQNKALIIAEKLAEELYSIRDLMPFKSLPFEQAFCQALALIKPFKDIGSDAFQKPIVIADQADNPGAGAPSDSTFALRWLLDKKIKNAALAIFYDPQVVSFSVLAGVGAELVVRLGGKLGVSSGDPIDVSAKVRAINLNYFHRFPQDNGESLNFPIGDAVALEIDGVVVIVASQRCQCYSPCIFADFGVDIEKINLIIVKSSQHFYSAFNAVAEQIFYMDGPGATSPSVKKINYQKMSTENKYPWNKNPIISNGDINE